MNTEEKSVPEDRFKFIVAIMTREYANAIDIGTSILNREPNDRHVRNCVSALRKISKSGKTAKLQEKISADEEANASTSGTEESDEADSSTDESVDDSEDETCTSVIDASKMSKGAENSRSSKSLKDYISEAVSATSGSKDPKLFAFSEKMYRVLPLKFTRKK